MTWLGDLIGNDPAWLSRLTWWLGWISVGSYIIGSLAGAGYFVIASQRSAMMEAQQAPRRLSVTQRARLIDLLSPVKGAKIRFGTMVGDGEAMEYAMELSAAIQEAGWVPAGGGIGQHVGLLAKGVLVVIADDKEPPPGTKLLLDTLRQIGIPAEGVVERTWEKGSLTLIVGRKA